MTAIAPQHIRWHMAADLRQQLLGPNGLPITDWLRDGTATTIKDAPHRAVYRVQLPGLDCHVKHYRLLGWRSQIRSLLRPIKARREFELADELKCRGILTPEPLAWADVGTGIGPRASWLITATAADAVPLLGYLESTLPRLTRTTQIETRQRLARTTGVFLARLHAAGVLHNDLHPGNLLLDFDENGSPRLWLIDLHAVALGQPCSWSQRRANLVVFNRFFHLRASRSDRARFWRSYIALSGTVIPAPAEAVARELETETDRSNQRFWRARDARCLRSNRYYSRLRSSAGRGYALRQMDATTSERLVRDPDAPFGEPDTRLFKDSRSSTVAEVIVAGRPCIYKRFRLTDRRDPWLGLARPTATLRSWVFGHGLQERLLPTARPLFVFHRVKGGLPHEGYLLTEKIENAVDLHEAAKGLAHLPHEERTAELRGRIQALSRLIRLLHARGLTHRDLKATNLLAAAEVGDHRLWFIDLVGVRRHRRVGRRRKVQNLTRLHVSFAGDALVTRTEKLRFLLTYLHSDLRGSDGWKRLWRSIAAATKVKLAKNARTGRPVA
jgi:tRNA A-37 threonylcarbamoyl transferase component Bud32